MPTQYQKFTGFHPSKINSKRNVQLPRGWRDNLSEPFYICRGQEHDLPCIQVIPQMILHGTPPEFDGMDWTIWEKKIHAKELRSENYRPIQSGTRARMTLPRDWCDEVGIQAPGSLMLAGRGCWFEFWSPANFHATLERESQLQEVFERMEGPF